MMPRLNLDLHDCLENAGLADSDDPMADGLVRIRIALDIAEGLAYIAGKNVVHCDVKPANVVSELNNHFCFFWERGPLHLLTAARGIVFVLFFLSQLLTSSLRATIADFGSARVVDRAAVGPGEATLECETVVNKGTPGYDGAGLPNGAAALAGLPPGPGSGGQTGGGARFFCFLMRKGLSHLGPIHGGGVPDSHRSCPLR